MHPVTQSIHHILLRTKTEEFFILLRRWSSTTIRIFIPIKFRHKFPSFGRFVPNASEYPSNDCYLVTRNNTVFKINRSDYVHWRLFYGVRDNALKAAKKYLEPGAIILDLGANFGAFSLRLATYIVQNKFQNIQIHAFEPNPVAFRYYQENLALNTDLANTIQLHSKGLGDRNEQRSFLFEQSNTGAGRVVNESDGKISVMLQRLDDFLIPLNPIKIAFIKLIVEGFEPQVLQGGWESIKKHKPPIFMEVTPSWWTENHSTVEETLGKLTELGYTFRIEHHNEMLPYEPSRHASRFQYNLLATVKNNSQRFK